MSDVTQPDPRRGLAGREQEWSRWLAVFVLAVGLLVLLPALVYQLRHLKIYWPRPLTTVKAMGYLAALATLAAVVSGLVLTWQGLFARRISYLWDDVHVVSTFALIAFALAASVALSGPAGPLSVVW